METIVEGMRETVQGFQVVQLLPSRFDLSNHHYGRKTIQAAELCIQPARRGEGVLGKSEKAY